jgi:hypothetical protein
MSHVAMEQTRDETMMQAFNRVESDTLLLAQAG